MHPLAQRALHRLLPPRCQHCGATTPGPQLCAPCAVELPWNTPACPGCALPSASGAPCPACLQAPEPFDAACSALRLEGPVQSAVHGLKYSGRLLNAALLAEALAATVKARNGPLPQRLLPMPLARGRLWQRGFNQALEISRLLGRELGIAVDCTSATRLRATPDQIGQSRRERQASVAGAFAVGPEVAGLHIALVDDVMTTGASLAELARMARLAGAARVEAWSVARTPLQRA